jgi:hypothetical protein
MVIDAGETAEVRITSQGESAKTDMTCRVHIASQVIRVSHVSDGSCGSRLLRPIPKPLYSVDYFVN